MKKLFTIFMAVVCILSLAVSVYSYDRAGDELEVKLFCKVGERYYFADVAENKSDDVRVGETLNLSFNDFSDLKSANVNGSQEFGIMLIDDDNGEGTVTYHLSDIVVKSNGNADKTVSSEGTFTDTLKKGIYEDDTAIVHSINLDSSGAGLESVSEVSFSINYISYDDNGVNTAESIPEEEETVPDLPQPPATGISYSILPLMAGVILVATTYRRR